MIDNDELFLAVYRCKRGRYSQKDMILIADALDELERLQAKETPMKIDTNFGERFLALGGDFYRCPSCKMAVITLDDKYCCKCGQALDWSDK